MNLKAEIAKRVGVAITLLSFWTLYDTVLWVLVSLVVMVLIASCIVLPFRNRLLKSRWSKLAEASTFEVTFTALGLGMVTSGLRLVLAELTWLGLATTVAGVFFIGAGIGDNLVKLRRKKK